jgi:hypothetical protein
MARGLGRVWRLTQSTRGEATGMPALLEVLRWSEHLPLAEAAAVAAGEPK